MRNPAIFFLLFFFISHRPFAQNWPASDSITKPWTRWWWMGSAVNENGLTQNLDLLKTAGIGGVEITPIYGVKGQEKSFIPFLSDRWIELFQYTLNVAAKNGMGVDLANATGWPFGGPWVGTDDASKTIFKRKFTLEEGQSLDSPLVYRHKGFVRTANTIKRTQDEIPRNFINSPYLQEWALDQLQFAGTISPETVMAYGPAGEVMDLSHLLDSASRLLWKAPKGKWNIWVLYKGLHGKMVERAAPGGEGYAIDHFSITAVSQYLNHFTKAFKGTDLKYLRGYFNDSYEVDDASGQANWTNNLFDHFQRIKQYDLRHYLPYLFGEGDTAIQQRVVFDFRSTIDSLMLGHFTETWKEWGTNQGKLLRNQSHGSPANTLDLYAAVDIPETEGTEWLRFKFAASAAHIMGKKLISAEAATWLDEHFLSTWADVKKALDLYFLAGINHIVYHGTPYTSPAAAWPGWNFYAAVEFQPTNPQWKHFRQLNEYVTRIQSFLQQSTPDHQVLLYYPLHDRYAQLGGPLLQHFDGMEKNFEHTDFEQLAKQLQHAGIGFDFISDRQLKNIDVKQGKLLTGGVQYKTILVPEIQFMDLPAWISLQEMAAKGATVIFHRKLPDQLPGLYDLERRKKELRTVLSGLNWTAHPQGKISAVGKGEFIVAEEWGNMLIYADLTPGQFESKGLRSCNMKMHGQQLAFIVNPNDRTQDHWFDLGDIYGDMLLFDPMSGQISRAAKRTDAKGNRQFRLLLAPFSSMIVKWEQSAVNVPVYNYLTHPTNKVSLNGNWSLHFDEGGPFLPNDRSIERGPVYWTTFSDSSSQFFSGLATYQTKFELADADKGLWELDLGAVAATASVTINGQPIGISIGPTHRMRIPQGLLKKKNILSIQVANLMANRISYMDKHDQPWKIFYNINMSARRKENLLNGVFDARHWNPQHSGLNGPVQLLKYTSIE